MSKKINGNKLIIALSDWWYSSFGLEETEESKAIQKVLDAVERYVDHEKSAGDWIPCSERLPKEDEYVGNVCKYYLIQDEYGDMHVAHLSGRGWETIESVKALGCDVVAWVPLPEPYREDGDPDETD